MFVNIDRYVRFRNAATFIEQDGNWNYNTRSYPSSLGAEVKLGDHSYVGGSWQRLQSTSNDWEINNSFFSSDNKLDSSLLLRHNMKNGSARNFFNTFYQHSADSGKRKLMIDLSYSVFNRKGEDYIQGVILQPTTTLFPL